MTPTKCDERRHCDCFYQETNKSHKKKKGCCLCSERNLTRPQRDYYHVPEPEFLEHCSCLSIRKTCKETIKRGYTHCNCWYDYQKCCYCESVLQG